MILVNLFAPFALFWLLCQKAWAFENEFSELERFSPKNLQGSCFGIIKRSLQIFMVSISLKPSEQMRKSRELVPLEASQAGLEK